MNFIKQNWLVLLLILLLAVATFMGYGYFNKYKNLQNKLEITKTQDDLFQKRQDCASYTPEIERELKNLDFSNPKTQADIYHYLERVFYSPKANSCLYVEKEITTVNGNMEWVSYTLYDVLTKQIITSSLMEWGSSEYQKKEEAFNNYVKEYE